MRYVLITVGVLVALIVIVVVIGYSLPVKHRASRSAVIAAPPADVFALITRVEDFPAWRKGLERVDIVDRDAAGNVVHFREHSSTGPVLFELTERKPNERVVGRIADPKLPFGGRWVYELSPTAGGTQLTITEEGEIYNPVFRFVARFFMGYTSTLDQYLASAQSRFTTPPSR